MPNKVKNTYQQQSVYVGPTAATGQHFARFAAESLFTGANLLTGLYRVQSCNYSFQVNRTPVNQFGELAAIDRVILESPSVSLSLNYLLFNFWNERALGFGVDGRMSALSGILGKIQDDKNYFVKIVGEGQDSVNNTQDDVDVAVIGFGNGFISSYSSQAAVNGFPTVDIGVEALNMTFASGLSGKLPAVNPTDGTRVTQYHYVIPTGLSSPGTGLLAISVLRPGDITMSFKSRTSTETHAAGTFSYPGGGVDINGAKIQSYTLSFDMGREPLQKLGSKFAFSREPTFPIDISLSVEAIVGDLTTGSISDIVNSDGSYDVTININKPVPPGDPQIEVCKYIVKGAKINGHSYTQGIGDNKSVTIDFAAQVGGPTNQHVGLFLSGIVTPV